MYGYGGCTEDSTRVVGIVLMTAVGGVMWLIFTVAAPATVMVLVGATEGSTWPGSSKRVWRS